MTSLAITSGSSPTCVFFSMSPSTKGNLKKLLAGAALVTGVVLAIHFGAPLLASLNLSTAEWIGVGAATGVIAGIVGCWIRAIGKIDLNAEEDEKELQPDIIEPLYNFSQVSSHGTELSK